MFKWLFCFSSVLLQQNLPFVFACLFGFTSAVCAVRMPIGNRKQTGGSYISVETKSNFPTKFSQLLTATPVFRHYIICKFQAHRFSALPYILQRTPSTCSPIPLHKTKYAFLYTTNLELYLPTFIRYFAHFGNFIHSFHWLIIPIKTRSRYIK